MASEGEQRLACRGIPDTYGCVFTPRHYTSSIRRPGDSLYRSSTLMFIGKQRRASSKLSTDIFECLDKGLHTVKSLLWLLGKGLHHDLFDSGRKGWYAFTQWRRKFVHV